MRVQRTCSVDDCDADHHAKGFCKRHWRSERPCGYEGCPKPHNSRGYCAMHRRRQMVDGDLGPPGMTVFRNASAESCRDKDCSQQPIARGWCGKHYQRWRTTGDPRAIKKRKSAGFLDRHGYRRFSVDGVSYLEHRVVMEQHLGRPLLPSENVHHRDLDRANNALGNLELWVTKQPKGARAVDLLAWAREIIARYEPVEDKL